MVTCLVCNKLRRAACWARSMSRANFPSHYQVCMRAGLGYSLSKIEPQQLRRSRMFIGIPGKEATQLRQERNVNGRTENIALLTELPKYLRSRLSINILFLRNWLSV